MTGHEPGRDEEAEDETDAEPEPAIGQGVGERLRRRAHDVGRESLDVGARGRRRTQSERRNEGGRHRPRARA